MGKALRGEKILWDGEDLSDMKEGLTPAKTPLYSSEITARDNPWGLYPRVDSKACHISPCKK